MSNVDKIPPPKQNLYSVKPWSSRLHGKIPAIELRELLERRLRRSQPLLINMAGVKEVTPGFARECFGELYILAVSRGCQIKFTSVPDHLKPVLRNGVAAALRPRYERD